MAFCIELKKMNDKEDFVNYSYEYSVPFESYISKSGKERYRSKLVNSTTIPKKFARDYTATGKLEPKTWGEAIHSRIGIQEHTYFQNRMFPERFPNGSIYDPLVTGRGPR